jgi:3-hydroxybutyrate dehydrogenase
MFKGKTALVTGSTSGIGLGIAKRLAADGANIVLNGFGDASEIERIAKSLKEESRVGVLYDGADMSKADAVAAMMQNAIAAFGAVDILVNNAGIQHVAPVDDFPVAKWDAILAINLSAAFHTVRAALPAMKKKGWGRIVNIASAHALVASPFKSAYVAAKHGIAGFTKTVALEVAEQGITVNAVIRDVLLAAQPTKKFVTVEEVAALTAFLCSNEAASITGSVLPIEGGWTAH